jgi:hypothetical protein
MLSSSQPMLARAQSSAAGQAEVEAFVRVLLSDDHGYKAITFIMNGIQLGPSSVSVAKHLIQVARDDALQVAIAAATRACSMCTRMEQVLMKESFPQHVVEAFLHQQAGDFLNTHIVPRFREMLHELSILNMDSLEALSVRERMSWP